MLRSYKSIAKDLTHGGHVRPEHSIGWARAIFDGTSLDPRHHHSLEGSLAGQNAISDIEHAEDLLAQVGSMVSFLSQRIPDEERLHGWSEEFVSSVQESLRQVAERLRAGEYLRVEDFAKWDATLRAARITRRELRVSYLMKDRERLGINIDYIEQCPPGPWWERLREFDGQFLNCAGTDLSERER